MSPIQKKWHFYGQSTKSSKKIKSDNIQFLVFTSLHKNIIAAHKLAITSSIKNVSPYLNESKYIKSKTKITKIRTKTNTNNFYRLYNKQKSICKFCKQSMKFENIVEKIKPEKLEIHRFKPLFIEEKHSGYINKSLLHKFCHLSFIEYLKKIK